MSAWEDSPAANLSKKGVLVFPYRTRAYAMSQGRALCLSAAGGVSTIGGLQGKKTPEDNLTKGERNVGVELKPWETDWPEGCNLFLRYCEGIFFTDMDGLVEDVSRANNWSKSNKQMLAYVAYAWFMRRVELAEEAARVVSMSEEMRSRGKRDEAIRECIESARAWAEWGGI